jgi:anti-anti-sigma regulatory factor
MQSSGPASEAAGSPPSTVWPEPIGRVPIFSALRRVYAKGYQLDDLKADVLGNALRGDDFVVMILHLGKVPVIDSTGLVALDNAIGALVRRRCEVVLAGPLPQPRSVFDRLHLQRKHATLHIAGTLQEALELSAQLAAQRLPARASGA